MDKDRIQAQFPDWPVDSIVRLMEVFPNGAQVAMATRKDGVNEYLGLRRIADSLFIVNNADSVFEIGSISKVFTSALLAKAVVEERIDPYASVWPLLDLEPAVAEKITPTQLANHTSGLPRMPSNFALYALTHPQNPYKGYDEEKLRHYLTKKAKLQTPPDSVYAYSNLGAGTLGYLLTRVYNQSYEQLLREQLAGPLNMNNTTTDRSAIQDRLVRGVKPNGQPAANWDLNILVGAGGILSTTHDLMQFVQAQLSKKDPVWQRQQKKTFQASENMALGLGWHILYPQNGATWYWHNGGTGGYRTSMVMDTAQQRAAIVLTNVSAAHPHARDVDQLSFDLLRAWH